MFFQFKLLKLLLFLIFFLHNCIEIYLKMMTKTVQVLELQKNITRISEVLDEYFENYEMWKNKKNYENDL